MSASDFLRDLLHELQNLYDRIYLMLLHKRMHGYHRSTSRSIKPHTQDIKSSLLEYVDKVVVVDKEKTKTPPKLNCPTDESEVICKHTPQSQHIIYPFNFDKKQVVSSPYKINKKQVKELSNYFKARKKGTELHPGIKEKLKGSVWDHINASIQCALKGDSRNAKMHVDIANYAFKEIAHYMPEEQYQVLTEKINKRLDVLKADQ